MGGYSSEFEISIKSGEVVYKTLSDEDDLNLYRIIIKSNEWFHIDDEGNKFEINRETFQLNKKSKVINFDIVFNTIHGIPGENGEIQKYLEKKNIKQTSSNSISSKITFDKNACKKEIRLLGYNTAKSTIIHKGDSYTSDMIFSNLKLPLFIKPNEGGSSFGISRIINENNLSEAISECFKECNSALIEEEIKGREISVGVIRYNKKVIALPPTEIIPYNSFFDYNAKYKGESDEITPANLSQEELNDINKISIDIYEKLKLEGFSICDFILNQNKFYFLEVNTNPGLTEESILPQQANAANISLKKLFRSVIDNNE